MQKYKLVFKMNFDDEFTGDSVESGEYTIIIEAETPEAACKIGEDMIGMHVYERQWLTELISVSDADPDSEPIDFNEAGQPILY